MSASSPRPAPGTLRPGQLTIEVMPDGDVLTLRLRGEFDLASVPAVDEAVLAARTIPRRLIIDLSELTFIDSSGIHLLLRTQRHVGGRLSLRPGPPAVQRVLALTKVADQFTFETDPPVPAHGSRRCSG